jgi:hypothetical protein
MSGPEKKMVDDGKKEIGTFFSSAFVASARWRI